MGPSAERGLVIRSTTNRKQVFLDNLRVLISKMQFSGWYTCTFSQKLGHFQSLMVPRKGVKIKEGVKYDVIKLCKHGYQIEGIWQCFIIGWFLSSWLTPGTLGWGSKWNFDPHPRTPAVSQWRKSHCILKYSQRSSFWYSCRHSQERVWWEYTFDPFFEALRPLRVQAFWNHIDMGIKFKVFRAL